MKNLLALFLFISVIVTTGALASDKKEKKEKKAKLQLEMAQLINSGRFLFVPNSASTSIGNINNIVSSYEMVFDSLNIWANLPYYGRTYASFYQLAGGVKFNYTAKKINKSWHERKKEYTINFDVKNNPDSYSVDFTAKLNGFAILKLTFSDHELISYYGTIQKIEIPQKAKK